MRRLLLPFVCLAACVQTKPAQDPLDYLRVGVDPHQEADAIIEDLQKHGFQIGRRVDERRFVAFDAVRGPDSTVRVVTSRGPSMSMQLPDARWPDRLWAELDSELRPDFDQDGEPDVVVAIRERERTCLAWAQVDVEGFVSEVFRPSSKWGQSPCIVEIDPRGPRLVLEVSVPGAPAPGARVRLYVRASEQRWMLDDSPSATAAWELEVDRRNKGLEIAESIGDLTTAERIRAELAWLDQLRNGEAPVLEPTGDGDETR